MFLCPFYPSCFYSKALALLYPTRSAQLTRTRVRTLHDEATPRTLGAAPLPVWIPKGLFFVF